MNKVISDVYVAGPFAAGGTPIFLKENGTFIVLKDDGILICVALGFKEVSCPKDLWHEIVYGDQLCFGGAPGMY